MNEQQLSFQLGCPADGRRSLVTVTVFFRCAHEAFGIDWVIESPVCRSGNGNSGLECPWTFAHWHQRVVSSIAPAPDTNTASIYVRQSREVFSCFSLVGSFFHADRKVSAFFECCSSTSSTTSVHADHDIAFVAHYGFKHTSVAETSDTPLVEYLLRAGTTILVHDYRIFLGRIEVGRFHHPTVQFYSFTGFEREKLFCRHV